MGFSIPGSSWTIDQVVGLMRITCPAGWTVSASFFTSTSLSFSLLAKVPSTSEKQKGEGFSKHHNET